MPNQDQTIKAIRIGFGADLDETVAESEGQSGSDF